MGGKAFGEVATKRIPSREELERVRDLVKRALENEFGRSDSGRIRVEMPAELEGKADFGDLDLLFSFEDDRVETRVYDVVYEALGCTQRVSRGKATHFLTREGYQVDLKCVPSANFALELLVFSNGDMWHMMNLSLFKYGLAVGEKGFYIRSNAITPHLNDNFLISTNPEKICEFLGFPIDRIYDSNKMPAALSMQSVFELMSQTRFFNPNTILDHAKKSTCQSKKTMQRPMFREFVNLFSAHENVANDLSNPTAADRETLAVQLATWFDKLADLQAAKEFAKLKAREEEFKKICKTKLNGSLIAQRHPMLQGFQIGRVIANIKGTSGWETLWTEWLKQASELEVFNRVDLEASQVVL